MEFRQPGIKGEAAHVDVPYIFGDKPSWESRDSLLGIHSAEFLPQLLVSQRSIAFVVVEVIQAKHVQNLERPHKREVRPCP